MDDLELTLQDKTYLNGLLLLREVQMKQTKESHEKLYGEVPKVLQESLDDEERSIARIREKLLYF